VSVQREERNPQRFWVAVVGALQQTAAGSTVVRPLTTAPDLDGWAVVERLLKDLESLQDRAWLVIDDVHELRSAEVLRQLELLLMRAPAKLRWVLGAHGRTEAVTQARALGLLAPSPMRPEVSGHRDQQDLITRT
jgi:LuxR family transcriptional regulator, maltose regulon positive regulatory protein